ncbi:deoxyribonuclease [Haladaptatus sp. W1]|uniref:TRAM domain-containing protein n=1 Tax=Haladaptatus sp. W1 TaxID=1897478 RepID=UPI000849B719|nr:TRAM domain-containing protein [Haladaptatus sp. W1]ODR81907.1 deoxyribonuclease [Haladaptatus sp. W1]
MPDCPLADDCPSFEERINGMGCHHYGDRGGAEWCNHYNQPIRELKTAPVQPGEEVVVDIDDIHESGSGVGRTEDGFIVLVDGVLPDARAKVKITNVKGNHALADPIERLPMEPEETDKGGEEAADGDAETKDDRKAERRQHLGSRDNFWGG